MSNIGNVQITDDVISSIAGAAAMKIEGVHSLSGGMVEGLTEMLGKKQFSKGINVKLSEEDGENIIEVNIVVKHGYKIQDVAKSIQVEVKKDIKSMIGLKIDVVNVYVDKVKIEIEKNIDQSEEKKVEEGK